MMRIAVAGTGYVGMSLAVLLAQQNQVTAVDIVPEKVELINGRKSPIQDDYIEQYLREKKLNLTATLDGDAAYRDADFVIVAAPTNYDSKKNFFDTSAGEAVIRQVMAVNKDAIIVIKSTIPVGFTERIRQSTHNHLAVVTLFPKGDDGTYGDACGGCFHTITPQRLIDIASGKKLVICEHCGRIIVNPEI